MSVVVEVIIAVAILAFIVLILKCGVEERYTYEEYEDENGNIVEKVFDHKDKGEN
jgi:hypothetical protein